MRDRKRDRAYQKAYHAAYYRRHRDQLRAYSQEWRQMNPDQEHASKHEYWLTHRHWSRDARRAYNRKWRIANAEKVRETGRVWKLAHPELIKQYRARTNARRKGASGSHTLTEWHDKIELHVGCCIYCGLQKPLERDHNVPLSRGGSDDISNILPACGTCNRRKGTRTAQEFLLATVR